MPISASLTIFRYTTFVYSLGFVVSNGLLMRKQIYTLMRFDVIESALVESKFESCQEAMLRNSK